MKEGKKVKDMRKRGFGFGLRFNKKIMHAKWVKYDVMGKIVRQDYKEIVLSGKLEDLLI